MNRTLIVVAVVGISILPWIQGCGGKTTVEPTRAGTLDTGDAGGTSGASGTGGSVGSTGGSAQTDACPGLGCAPNCGNAGVAIDENGCLTCMCNPEPDGGTGGTAILGCGSGTCDSLEQCFNSQFCVAKLVPITAGYSIDATEVTRDQYARWLATTPQTDGQVAYCSWNIDHTPDTSNPDWGCDLSIWPPGFKGKHPVVCVDWCDAYAYCKAVGKRLCGRIGGGANGIADYADAAKSQWYDACSSGGQYEFQ